MTSTMDRRLGQLQSKVQQEINLMDDKIQRNEDYLDSLMAEIADYEDKLRRVQYKQDQAQEEQIGKKRANQATVKAQAAKMISEHNADMAALMERMKQEETAISKDFEEHVAQMDEFVQRKLNARVQQLELQIEATQKMVQKYQEKLEMVPELVGTPEDYENDSVRELELKQIQALEKQLKENNQARLASLLEAKSHLSDCVDTLEQMDQRHAVQMESLKNKLMTMDASYDDKLKKMKQAQARDREAMNRKIREAESRVKGNNKLMRRLERNHAREITGLRKENEFLRDEYQIATANELHRKIEQKRVQDDRIKAENLTVNLRAREDVLMKMRTDNETMKREIARIQHEERLEKRRRQLGLA